MEQIWLAIAVAAGVVFGFLIAWVSLRSDRANIYAKGKADAEKDRTSLEERILAKDNRIQELQQERGAERETVERLREENAALRATHIEQEARLSEVRHQADDKLALVNESQQKMLETLRESLTVKITEQEERSKALAAELELAGRQVETLRGEKAVLEAAQEPLTSHIRMLEERVAVLTAENEQLRAAAAAAPASSSEGHVQAAAEGSHQELELLKAELTALRAAAAANPSAAEVEDLRAENARLEAARLEALSSASQQALAPAASEDLDQLRAAVEQLRSENAALAAARQEALAAAEAAATPLPSEQPSAQEWESLRSEADALRSANQRLESEAAARNAEAQGAAESLNAQLEALQADKVRLEAALDDAEREHSQSQHEHQQSAAGLTAERDDLLARIAGLEAEKTQLEQRQQEQQQQQPVAQTPASGPGSAVQDALLLSLLSGPALQQTGAGGIRHSVEDLLAPLRASLDRFDAGLAEIERSRQSALAEIREKADELARQKEQQKIDANPYRHVPQPEDRSGWTAAQLRQAVESAGLAEQADLSSGHLSITLPGGKKVLVAAANSVDLFLDAAKIQDDAERASKLDEMALHLGEQLEQLSRSEFEIGALFLPSEQMLNAALERGASLFEPAAGQSKAVLATPHSLTGLLRTVKATWQQYELADLARQLKTEASEQYRRLAEFNGSFEHLRGTLTGAVRAFDQAAHLLGANVLPHSEHVQRLAGNNHGADSTSSPGSPLEALDHAVTGEHNGHHEHQHHDHHQQQTAEVGH